MDPFFAGILPRVRDGFRPRFAGVLLIGAALNFCGLNSTEHQPLMAATPITPVMALADSDAKPPAAADDSGDLKLQQLEADRDVMQKRLAMLNDDIEKQLSELDKGDTDTADLKNQESALEDLRNIIKRIGNQLYLWNIELEAEMRIKVVEMASVPNGNDAQTKSAWAGFASVVGFCVALLLVKQSPRRSWTSAVASGLLLGGLAGAAVMVLVPIHYEAQSLIKVQKIRPALIQNVQNGGQDDEESYDLLKKTQLQLLKSNFVLSRAARRSEVLALPTMQEHKNDPVGFLESKLIVDYPGDAELMRVAMKGTHRDDLPVIVNAVVQSYMDEIVNGDKISRLKQRDLLTQHYSKNQEEFRNRSEKFHALARRLGISNSESARMRKKIAEQRLESMVESANALAQRIRDQELEIMLLKERKAKAGDGAYFAPLSAAGNFT